MSRVNTYELAVEFNMSENTIRKLIKTEGLPCYRKGMSGAYWFDLEEVEKWMRGCAEKTRAPQVNAGKRTR